MDRTSLDIGPTTKVLRLIETYPHLEDVLISHVPAFRKLKNPVLRRTVAKIATLRQAAAIGNVKLEDLLNLLRKAAGQDTVSLPAEVAYNPVQPDWVREDRIIRRLDIRELLDAGEQPLNQVMAGLNKLKTGEIFQIISPFIPAPLIDRATGSGFDNWVDRQGAELFIVFFRRKEERPSAR